MLIDSHCHLDRLDLSEYGGVEGFLEHLSTASVETLLTVSTDYSSTIKCVKYAKSFPQIYATVGTHPLSISADSYEQDSKAKDCFSFVNEKKVIAIGETGLDYHYQGVEPNVQREYFQNHIEQGIKSGLPVIVHTREAGDDTIDVLKDMGIDSCGGVIHCFTENYEFAKQVLDLGMYISISGIITYKNANTLRETVKKLPLSRLLIETDSPYLAPVPHRGKQNLPSYLIEVASALTDVVNTPLEKIITQTKENFQRLFQI